MERTAYRMRREGKNATEIKFILRERYGIKNARWNQSALNQAEAIMKSQEEGIKYKIELYREKIRNTKEKIDHLSNELKISGCKRKIKKFEKKVEELREQLYDKSYPQAVFDQRSSCISYRWLMEQGKRN